MAATGWATTTPEDELNRMPRAGLNFGFPYCHAGAVPDKDIKKANPCAGVTLPVQTMGPHAAAMGVHFYTGSMFPAEYRNTLFVARKGSWNRTQKFGYDVVTVRTDASGNSTGITPFMTGFLDASTQAIQRPADLLPAVARRLAAGVRRAARRDLPHQLRAMSAAARAALLAALLLGELRWRSARAAARRAAGGMRGLPRAGRAIGAARHAVAGRAAEAVHREPAGHHPRGPARRAGDETASRRHDRRGDRRARHLLRGAGAQGADAAAVARQGARRRRASRSACRAAAAICPPTPASSRCRGWPDRTRPICCWP